MDCQDVPEEERDVPADNKTIINLCATPSDIAIKAVVSVPLATVAPVCDNDHAAEFDSTVRVDSHGADDEYCNVFLM